MATTGMKNAAAGKSASAGGMNVPEMKITLTRNGVTVPANPTRALLNTLMTQLIRELDSPKKSKTTSKQQLKQQQQLKQPKDTSLKSKGLVLERVAINSDKNKRMEHDVDTIPLLPQIEYMNTLPARIKALIQLYTGTFYTEKYSKTADSHHIKQCIDAALQIAFNNIPPLKKELTVYRGVKVTPVFGKASQYISTSLDIDIAYRFMTLINDKEKCCLMIIKVPPGSKILPLLDSDVTSFPDEKEILLPINSDFSASETLKVPYDVKFGQTVVRKRQLQAYQTSYVPPAKFSETARLDNSTADMLYLLTEVPTDDYHKAPDKIHYLQNVAYTLGLQIDPVKLQKFMKDEDLEDKIIDGFLLKLVD